MQKFNPTRLFSFSCTYHDGMTEKREGRKRGPEEMMTTLTKRQTEAMWRLQANYDGEPKPVNSSVSIGGKQMTIDVGMEHACQLDIRKSNNAAMEMAIDDFFTVRIYITRLLSHTVVDE